LLAITGETLREYRGAEAEWVVLGSSSLSEIIVIPFASPLIEYAT
jgi:hypothetical protein